MCVCVFVCVCVCMCVCVCVCVCVCLFACALHARVCMCVCVCMRVSASMCVCVCMCVAVREYKRPLSRLKCLNLMIKDCKRMQASLLYRVGRNRIYTPYITVCMVISLLKLPYVHRIYVYMYGSGQTYSCTNIEHTICSFSPLVTDNRTNDPFHPQKPLISC